MKIVNIRYKNKSLITSFGTIKFDDNGVVDLPAEQASVLLALGGLFFDPNTQEKTTSKASVGVKPDNSSAEPSNTSESKEKAEDLSNLNIMQLKKLAKERGIELGDANKKDEIIAVIKSAQ